jgi:hypothetical protein
LDSSNNTKKDRGPVELIEEDVPVEGEMSRLKDGSALVQFGVINFFGVDGGSGSRDQNVSKLLRP